MQSSSRNGSDVRKSVGSPLVSANRSDCFQGRKCSVCNAVNSRKKGRECFVCQNFFHLSCVKLSGRASALLPVWKCRSCLLPSLPLDQQASASVKADFDAQSTLLGIGRLRRSKKIPIKIPKAARFLAADILTLAIDKAVSSDGPEDWNRLFYFAPVALSLPDSQLRENKSAATVVKHQLSTFMHSDLSPSSDSESPAHTQVFPNSNENDSSKAKRLRKGVNAKLIEGDVSAAVRLVVSEDTILQPTDEVLEALRLKHPDPPADFLPIFDPESTTGSLD